MFFADLLSCYVLQGSQMGERKSAWRVEMHGRAILRAEELFNDLTIEEIKRSAKEDNLY